MAIVVDENDNISPMGIVRLETIIEELIQKKIITGSDYHDVPIEESSIDHPPENNDNGDNGSTVKKSIQKSIKDKISKVLKKDQPEISKAPLLSDLPIVEDEIEITTSPTKTAFKKKKKKEKDHVILISDDSDSKE